MKERTPAQIREHLQWVYRQPDYYTNRRKANKNIILNPLTKRRSVST